MLLSSLSLPFSIPFNTTPSYFLTFYYIVDVMRLSLQKAIEKEENKSMSRIMITTRTSTTTTLIIFQIRHSLLRINK